MPISQPSSKSPPATETEPLRVHLGSAAATGRFGAQLGKLLQPGDLLGLDGPLGAGKTCLMAGLARGLEVTGAVTSPTFTLVNQHVGRLVLHHADLYRLGSSIELVELGLWEAAESGGVLAIEWLSRFPDALPADRLELRLAFAQKPQRGRTVDVTAHGPRSAQRLFELRSRLK